MEYLPPSLGGKIALAVACGYLATAMTATTTYTLRKTVQEWRRHRPTPTRASRGAQAPAAQRPNRGRRLGTAADVDEDEVEELLATADLSRPSFEPRRVSSIVGLFISIGRALFWPAVSLAGHFVVLTRTSEVLAALPAIVGRYGSTITAELRLSVPDVAAAFRLGGIAHDVATAAGLDHALSAEHAAALLSFAPAAADVPQAALDALRAAIAAVDVTTLPEATQAAIARLLAEAGKVVNAGQPLSLSDLLVRLPGAIHAQATQRSALGQVLSVFSIVNVIWLVSILGIAALVIPFIAVFAQPIVALLWRLWDGLIRPLLVAIATALIPLYEPLAHAVALLVLVESFRFPVDEYAMTPVMVGLTGCALSTAATAFSWYSGRFDGCDFIAANSIPMVFTTTVTALAMKHDSILLALVSSIGLTTQVAANALAMTRIRDTADTFLVGALSVATTTTAAAVTGRLLFGTIGPFAIPVQLLTSAGLFVPLTAAAVASQRSSRRGVYKIALIGTLAAYAGIGYVSDVPALTRVAVIYAVIPAVLQYIKLFPFGEVPLFFSLSVAGYMGALTLNANPQYVSAMMASSVWN